MHLKSKTIYKSAVISAFITILITLSITVFILHSPQYHPQKLLTEYIHAVYSNDLETVYNYSAVKNSEFISKQAFKENFTGFRFTEKNLADFRIERISVENNKTLCFSVSYLAEDSSEGTFYMEAEISEKGIFGLNKYLVCPDKSLFAGLTVCAPDGTAVSLNGKDLEQYKTDENTASGIIFNIKYLLPGTYSLKSENGLCLPYEDKINVKNKGETAGYHINQMISKDAFDSLCSITESHFNMILQAAVHQDYSALKKLFSAEFTESRFDNYTDELGKAFYIGEAYTVTAAEAFDFEPQTDCETVALSASSEINIPFQFNYSYTAENRDFNGEEYTAQKKDCGILYIQYIRENGEWKINNITQQIWF